MAKLPLLELFEILREDKKFSLGIDEYQSMIIALRAGFGINNKEGLKRICYLLWVKSPEQKKIFDIYFNQLFSKQKFANKKNTSKLSLDSILLNKSVSKFFDKSVVIIFLTSAVFGISILLSTIFFSNRLPQSSVSSENSIESQIPFTHSSSQESRSNKPNSDRVSKFDTDEYKVSKRNLIVFWSGSLLLSVAIFCTLNYFVTRLKIGRNNIQSPLKPNITSPATSSENDSNLDETFDKSLLQDEKSNFGRYILGVDSFPISRRQMKQSWRYLRSPAREGALTELDVKGTLKKIEQQGFLIYPELKPKRANRFRLILLLDQGGSMVPFHLLSCRLYETALEGGQLGKADIYHFHNCPVDYFYRDPACRKAELIKDLQMNLRYKYTSLLIFSDAGSARGGYNPDRVIKTETFIKSFKQKTQYMVWLNPMPTVRWHGTTAEKIAGHIPMFELSRQGFQNAVNFLRGYIRY